jgi:hypothetical protein
LVGRFLAQSLLLHQQSLGALHQLACSQTLAQFRRLLSQPETLGETGRRYLDGSQQLGLFDRLDQIGHDRGAGGALDHLPLAMGSEQDDRHRTRVHDAPRRF